MTVNTSLFPQLESYTVTPSELTFFSYGFAKSTANTNNYNSYPKEYIDYVNLIGKYNKIINQNELIQLSKLINDLTLIKLNLINSIQTEYNSNTELINSQFNNSNYLIKHRNHELCYLDNQLFISKINLIKLKNRNNKSIEELTDELIDKLNNSINNELIKLKNKKNNSKEQIETTDQDTFISGDNYPIEEAMESDKLNLITILPCEEYQECRLFIVSLRPIHLSENILPYAEGINTIFDVVDDIVQSEVNTNNIINSVSRF